MKMPSWRLGRGDGRIRLPLNAERTSHGHRRGGALLPAVLFVPTVLNPACTRCRVLCVHSMAQDHGGTLKDRRHVCCVCVVCAPGMLSVFFFCLRKCEKESGLPEDISMRTTKRKGCSRILQHLGGHIFCITTIGRTDAAGKHKPQYSDSNDPAPSKKNEK